MKKIISFILIFIMIFSFTACGGMGNGFAEKEEEIIAAMNACKMEEAYALCDEALSLKLTDEEAEKVMDYKKSILTLCYSGTFIIKPGSFISVDPTEVGKNSYFQVSLLKDYDELFCRYTFEKFSEKELAAREYKQYLDDLFIAIDVSTKEKYTIYKYTDTHGNGISLQVFNENYSSHDFCVILDADLFDTDKIDMSNKRADLFDASIIVVD